ncbi:hypothetical protein KR51_00033250 [Rubidibacter lacunae KORDI 51-2]|uniref:Circadian oscillating protein COP23 n=1 Tax=Rubidibacter lacunae KORDI 51-2 TaxID=582515 RepID=U5DEK5_9CHRO|nr:COP23 domain-containing protein [Rubidibacter lacunae]ERN40046.1 hypothetical protein KR51_00033250 [Rubidibacter lacunae KORDI 51-2]
MPAYINRLSLIPIAGLTAIAIAPAAAEPPSRSGIQFRCTFDAGLPTTVAHNPSISRAMPIIRWQSQYFAESGFDNLTRCQQVTARFQQAYARGDLNYITAGVVNGLPVICATHQRGTCNHSNVLFTLEPDRNAATTLKELFAVRHQSGGPLVRGGEPTYPYIDVREALAPLATELGTQSEPTPDSWREETLDESADVPEAKPEQLF